MEERKLEEQCSDSAIGNTTSPNSSVEAGDREDRGNSDPSESARNPVKKLNKEAQKTIGKRLKANRETHDSHLTYFIASHVLVHRVREVRVKCTR